MSDENEVFEHWRSSTGKEKDEFQKLLVKLLSKHAHAVCWNKIPDLQNDHGWICNEAVYRALRHHGNFKGRSKFSTWFHRIVFNICNNALKAKQKKGEEVEVDDSLGDGSRGWRSAVDKIFMDQVKKMGSREDQEILRLLAAGYTKIEIGKRLGINAGLVQTRWNRLKERLRDAGSE
jgi:RNA polymerase sigma factor (sigma-70 family)